MTKTVTSTESTALVDESIINRWNEIKPDKPKVNYPTINFLKIVNSAIAEDGGPNQLFGKLTSNVQTDDGVQVDIVDIATAEFFPILYTQKVSTDLFEQYFIPEIEEWHNVRIFSKKTKALVAEGRYTDLKEKFQLKINTVAYVVYNGAAYRFVIPNSAWESFASLRKSLADLTMPMSFRISKMVLGRSGNNSYNRPEFALASPVPYNSAIEYVEKGEEIRMVIAGNKKNKAEDQPNKDVLEVSVDEAFEEAGVPTDLPWEEAGK